MSHFELAKQAAIETRAEEKAEQKSVDWWTTRRLFSEFMYLDAADRDYQAEKANEASRKYLAARANFLKNYNEEFDFGMRPIDVCEEMPAQMTSVQP